MNDPEACREKAEALAMLGLMYPESADRYRLKEQYWRGQEDQARRRAPSGLAVARSDAEQRSVGERRGATYTFYLHSGGGTVSRFEAFELGGDEFAPDRALRMLGEHPTCAYLAVTGVKAAGRSELGDGAAPQALDPAIASPALEPLRRRDPASTSGGDSMLNGVDPSL